MLTFMARSDNPGQSQAARGHEGRKFERTSKPRPVSQTAYTERVEQLVGLKCTPSKEKTGLRANNHAAVTAGGLAAVGPLLGRCSALQRRPRGEDTSGLVPLHTRDKKKALEKALIFLKTAAVARWMGVCREECGPHTAWEACLQTLGKFGVFSLS